MRAATSMSAKKFNHGDALGRRWPKDRQSGYWQGGGVAMLMMRMQELCLIIDGLLHTSSGLRYQVLCVMRVARAHSTCIESSRHFSLVRYVVWIVPIPQHIVHAVNLRRDG